MQRGLLLVAMAAISWGTVGIASKAIYELLGDSTFAVSLSMSFFRLALSVPPLFLACWYLLGMRTLHILRSDLKWIGLIGLAMALYQVCYFAAIARIGVTVAVLVALCLAPVIVVLLSAGFLGERVTPRVLVALGGALVGTILLIGPPQSVATSPQMLQGVGLAVGAACSYAIITLCSRLLAGRYHPLQPIAIGFGIGAVLLLPFVFIAGLVITYPPAGWIWLLHLGLVPTALGYTLFLAGMRYTTATVASITTLLEPLTSALLAWIIFDERLGFLGVIGALLLLGTMVLLYVPVRRRSHLR